MSRIDDILGVWKRARTITGVDDDLPPPELAIRCKGLLEAAGYEVVVYYEGVIGDLSDYFAVLESEQHAISAEGITRHEAVIRIFLQAYERLEDVADHIFLERFGAGEK